MSIGDQIGRGAGAPGPARTWAGRRRDRRQRLLCGVLALATFVLPGCSKSKTAGTGPEPTYSLSGQLLLIGIRRDETGTPLGDLMLDDADGVRVYLSREGVVIDSTASAAGGFAFQVPLGTYRAFARIGAYADSTEELHVHDAARAFVHAIQLAPVGLEPDPNPFHTTLRIPYSVVATGPARLAVVGIDGATIRTLVDQALVAGVYETIWDGRNTLGQQAPPGPYWIVLTAGPTREEGLAVRTPVSISGSVVITSRLADEINADLGSRSLVDADGLRIHLEGPGSSDSTVTYDGQFRFEVVGAGDYRVWTRLAPDGPAFEHTVTLATRDTTLAPLQIGPVGQMDNYPNPFAYPHGVGFEFDLGAAQPVELEVRTLAGARVWWHSEAGPAGLNHFHWNGVDQAETPVADGTYVMIVRAGGTVRHNVVFKESAPRPALRAARDR
jgi:hypothetical protein